MNKQKLPEGWKEVELKNGKKIKLKIEIVENPKKKFIAKSTPFRKIYLEKNFYMFFNKKEQNSILLHELGHKKRNLFIDFKNLHFSFFNQNKLMRIQEFEADKFSSIHGGKENMIKVLKKIRLLVNKGEIPYNLKTHPTIEERIKYIENLKDE